MTGGPTTAQGVLFGDTGERVRLAIPDADIVLHRAIDVGAPADECLARLISEIAWREETIKMWGRTMRQPRLVAWYGDAGASYRYSGKRYDPNPWTPLLASLRRRVEALAETTFDSVLANFYRDEHDSVSMHSDNERELGPEPCIASLSFGETRTFALRHIARAHPTVRIPLESGTLLVMKGATQRCWQHAVPKEKTPRGPRVNLTFRKIGDRA